MLLIILENKIGTQAYQKGWTFNYDFKKFCFAEKWKDQLWKEKNCNLSSLMRKVKCKLGEPEKN